MITRFETIINAMPEIKYFEWGILPEFNLTQDENIEFPVALMEPPRILDGFKKPRDLKRVINVYECDLLILKKSEFDDDYKITRKERFIALKDLAISFVEELMKNLRDVPLSDLQGWETEPVYQEADSKYKSGYFNIFDSNVDGIRLKVVVSMCEELSECLN